MEASMSGRFGMHDTTQCCTSLTARTSFQWFCSLRHIPYLPSLTACCLLHIYNNNCPRVVSCFLDDRYLGKTTTILLPPNNDSPPWTTMQSNNDSQLATCKISGKMNATVSAATCLLYCELTPSYAGYFLSRSSIDLWCSILSCAQEGRGRETCGWLRSQPLSYLIFASLLSLTSILGIWPVYLCSCLLLLLWETGLG